MVTNTRKVQEKTVDEEAIANAKHHGEWFVGVRLVPLPDVKVKIIPNAKERYCYNHVYALFPQNLPLVSVEMLHEVVGSNEQKGQGWHR